MYSTALLSGAHGPEASAPPGSVLEMQNLASSPELLHQNLHFNKTPRQFKCLLMSGKHYSNQMASHPRTSQAFSPGGLCTCYSCYLFSLPPPLQVWLTPTQALVSLLPLGNKDTVRVNSSHVLPQHLPSSSRVLITSPADFNATPLD